MHTVSVKSRQHCQMIDVTSEVNNVVRESGLTDGYVICFVPHTTAGVTIQENADPDVVHDLLWKLEDLIPHQEASYQHGEGNSDAHIKTSLVGTSEMVLIENGRLVLGTWQGIYFCEFDGPRQRRLMIQCMGDKG
jgi:secondary thiamine-phosphate synthase enzyme